MAVELIDIADELTRLWNAEQGQKRIRASLFNLILYVQKTPRTDFYYKLIKTVISKFPCRVMCILYDETVKEDYINATVQSETLGEKDEQIYCEVIHINVAGKYLDRVPYLILPHILPDLPVYLLWTQDPTVENRVLPHLQTFAHRIIFDSESTCNLQSYSRSILSLMHRFQCDIGDLNWSACSGWRNLLMQVFNHPDDLLSLTQSKMIRIYYNKSGTNDLTQHPEIEAAYFQAWLASRLNWQFQTIENNEGNIRISYRRPLREVVILLIPEEVKSIAAGAILAIDLESQKNKGIYNFKRHPQTRQVVVQYSNKDLCQLPYWTTLSGVAEGQETSRRIFIPRGANTTTICSPSWERCHGAIFQ